MKKAKGKYRDITILVLELVAVWLLTGLAFLASAYWVFLLSMFATFQVVSLWQLQKQESDIIILVNNMEKGLGRAICPHAMGHSTTCNKPHFEPNPEK